MIVCVLMTNRLSCPPEVKIKSHKPHKCMHIVPDHFSKIDEANKLVYYYFGK